LLVASAEAVLVALAAEQDRDVRGRDSSAKVAPTQASITSIGSSRAPSGCSAL